MHSPQMSETIGLAHAFTSHRAGVTGLARRLLFAFLGIAVVPALDIKRVETVMQQLSTRTRKCAVFLDVMADALADLMAARFGGIGRDKRGGRPNSDSPISGKPA